jgi:Raf kinase inhibitor-like YbhB/YbcL family protein
VKLDGVTGAVFPGVHDVLASGDGRLAMTVVRKGKPAWIVLDQATGETLGRLDYPDGFGQPFMFQQVGDSTLIQGADFKGLYGAAVADKMKLESVAKCDCMFWPMGSVPGGIWFARLSRDDLGAPPETLTPIMQRYDAATGALGPELEQNPLAPAIGPAGPGSGGVTLPAPPAGATFTSTAFADGDAIPSRHTCDGEDVSPDLAWGGAEDGVEEYAVEVTDLDAGDFVHWVVTGITGLTALPEDAGDPDGIGFWTQGVNSFGGAGWRGPCPNGAHRFQFTLYRSPKVLGLDASATAVLVHDAVEAAGGTAQQLVGTYGPATGH